MNNDIFSELEDLGFNDIKNLKIYKNSKTSKNENKDSSTKKVSPLYNKKVICPVCGCTFKAIAVKSSSYRMKSKDTDFFIRYSYINPYFYDVWVCNNCGYSALKKDFQKIRDYQKDLIKEKIRTKWKGKNYPSVYTVFIAIERYKLCLLNYIVMEAKASQKAMTCLKIAWMYRLTKNTEKELIFLKEALDGFETAYFNEAFPIYGMNKFTTMYLIGELNRRLGNDTPALKWLGNVITSPVASKRLKDLARDQKDIIKENLSKMSPEKVSENPQKIETTKTYKNKSKKGFFSKFFNK